MFDREKLLEFIHNRFRIDWDGRHGISHWARVKDNGLRLCEKYPEADKTIVELFAWLHDIERVNDGSDPEHGPRCAVLIVEELLGPYLSLTEQQAADLIIAIRDHSKGQTDGNITVRICWDADRLDLGRFGTLPNPELLCTEHAKTAEMIRWSHAKAIVNEYGFVDGEQIKY